MTLHYRSSNPFDLRDLGDLMAEWIAADNPKRYEWIEAPTQPSPDAYWGEGVWIEPPAIHRFAQVLGGWVVGMTLLDHSTPLPWEQAAASPRQLVACGDDVDIGWRYEHGVFAP